MFEIKNLMFQPLTFHLGKEGKTLHLNYRERKKIRQNEMSDEIKMAERRAFISITDLSAKIPSDVPENKTDESNPDTLDDQGSISRRKKGGK